MKVFISHSYADKDFVDLLAKRLKENDIDVWYDQQELKPGDNILQKVEAALLEAKYIIFVLSKMSVNSNWVQLELTTTLNKEVGEKEKFIIPILIEDCDIPSALRNRYFADFRNSFEAPFQLLLSTLKPAKPSKVQPLKTEPDEKPTTEYQVSVLQNAYKKGNLTLFCGAGISLDAGVPTWNDLLKSLLKEAFKSKEIANIETIFADIFQIRNNLSPIIIGKYLKNILGKDFLETVRNSLYEKCTRKSTAIDDIIELCRPKRGANSLKAIITYNFDDIIELKLDSNKIKHKYIYKEGERYEENELPIFHVHGFLPSEGELAIENEIVLSEDAYHTQFIDPFSWSNLVQLNYLNTSTCLFVGISLTDPNMRRLIDVSKRKSGKNQMNHYIIKRHYNMNDLSLDSSKNSDNALLQIIENIEDQDAKSLGINIIWIKEYKEIPEILKSINP